MIAYYQILGTKEEEIGIDRVVKDNLEESNCTLSLVSNVHVKPREGRHTVADSHRSHRSHRESQTS